MRIATLPKYAFAYNVMLTKCYTVGLQCAVIMCVCFFLFLFVNLQTRKESHIAYGVGLTILFFCLFSGGVMAFIQCCCNVLGCSDSTVG